MGDLATEALNSIRVIAEASPARNNLSTSKFSFNGRDFDVRFAVIQRIVILGALGWFGTLPGELVLVPEDFVGVTVKQSLVPNVLAIGKCPPNPKPKSAASDRSAFLMWSDGGVDRALCFGLLISQRYAGDFPLSIDYLMERGEAAAVLRPACYG